MTKSRVSTTPTSLSPGRSSSGVSRLWTRDSARACCAASFSAFPRRFGGRGARAQQQQPDEGAEVVPRPMTELAQQQRAQSLRARDLVQRGGGVVARRRKALIRGLQLGQRRVQRLERQRDDGARHHEDQQRCEVPEVGQREIARRWQEEVGGEQRGGRRRHQAGALVEQRRAEQDRKIEEGKGVALRQHVFQQQPAHQRGDDDHDRRRVAHDYRQAARPRDDPCDDPGKRHRPRSMPHLWPGRGRGP
jgi:hypothetical protein